MKRPLDWRALSALPILLAALAASLVSCHLTESSDDILVLTLSDSLKIYPKVRVAILDITGSDQLAEIWDEKLPDPPEFRYNLGKSQEHTFLVRVWGKDADEKVQIIKSIPWKNGKEGRVHVVEGAEAKYEIAGFKMTAAKDKDGDGHASSFTAWLDVDANTNFDTLTAKLFYQVEGNTTWAPLADKELFGIAGRNVKDSVTVNLEGSAHRIVNFKAEIYEAFGKRNLVTSAELKGFKEETAAQDSAGLRWVLKNHTGAVLTVSGQVGATAFSNLELKRNDSLVRVLVSKKAADQIIYKAVAEGPGEAVEFSDTAGMEMDDYRVAPVLGPLKDYFVLNLMNSSTVAIDQIIINPGAGANEKRYDVTVPPGLNEYRNMGLFPYVTGTTLGLRFNGTEKNFDMLVFDTNTLTGFRFADFTLR